MSNRSLGLIWCAVFVVLDAAQAVVFGTVLQRMDSLLVGIYVFGTSALLCLVIVVVRARHELQIACVNPALLAALNVSSAVGWLFYLGAVQLIEPAVAFTLFSGIIPLSIVVARRADGDGPRLPLSAWERCGLFILAIGLVALAASTIGGLSGFVRGGFFVAVCGVLLSLFSGVAMAGMVLASYRLSDRGLSPAAVFALRFPLYLLFATCGYLLGFDDKGAVPAADFAAAVALGLAVLAFPIYAVQKAVSLRSSLTLGAATALIPVAALFLQTLEGRVGFSAATALGLAIYTVGAVIAAAARTRAELKR
ncbi:hypothetical protein W911_10665 [Hyphomicrobium nitrativorans NL23]|uniref:EamA domain-containing protein n=1 Tax=Hyphomicrobium nitrativorans NL23 TaxID=1029756 RepID=V5SH30_9HYPH|nr:hypothetical protein [Hyphomicrobium nitrativorans]AHB50196.1 hypothetical protein W911_10665 [Hyphomicrobium nitrativorans NL23]